MSESQQDNPRITQALAYLERGWRVLQLHGIQADGKSCTCSRSSECKTPGKHPVQDGWQNQAPMTEAEVRKAWSHWRKDHNVGIATGAASGFWVLDVDPDKGGMESAKRLLADHEPFNPTRIVRTGSGGYHYLFSLPDFDITNSPGDLKKDYPGIDVRGTGGQVVAPPSVTDKGGYTVVADIEPTAAPAWLLDMLRPKTRATPAAAAAPVSSDGDPRLTSYAKRAWDGEVERLVKMAEAAVPEGQTYVGEPWDITTFEVACNLLELANADWSRYTPAEVRHTVFRYAPRDSTFTDEDVLKKIDSADKKIGDHARPAPAIRVSISDVVNDWDIPGDVTAGAPANTAPRKEWLRRSWDDVGNAQRMVDHYSDRLRYLPAIRSWALYDGGRWASVDSSVVQALVLRLFASGGRLQHTEALSYDDTAGEDDKGNPTMSERDEFMKWVAKQRMNGRITAAMNLTTSQQTIHASLDDFDADPLLFNVANGVINLATGDLQPHDPDLMLMKQSTVTYDKTASCHAWQAFLDKVMPDPTMQSYLQRIVGYSLSGSIAEQAFFIHHGAGANGKSVFLQVIRAAVGEYGQSVPRDALLAKKNAEHPTSVARMVGMRFLEVSETAPGKRLDEEMVKGLTGGEKQTARFMGKDFFDFTPSGKIHYVTNHLPRLSDAASIWRRLHLIKWGVTIPHAEQDLHLAERIVRDELAGVLAWAVRGAQDWKQQRLAPPETAGRDIAAYREDMDAFGDFLTEYTRNDEESLAKTNDLYLAYKGWAFGAGIKTPMSQQAFTAVMKERGYEYLRRANGRFFKGLVVITPTAANAPWTD